MGKRPDTFYHGTSIEAALKIQAYGFDVALSGSNAGALLGPGVYCTTTLKKAMDYAEGKEAGGIIFELQADLGRCKTLAAGDAMMKTWQQHGYDSAWAPQGANHINLAENCIKDPGKIKIVRAIPGHTGELKAMGMLVRPDGRLAMMGDEAAAAAGGGGGRKRRRGQPAVDGELLALLRKWKLEDVADELANQGYTDVAALAEELPLANVAKLAVGLAFQNRLRKLLTHLHAARKEWEEQERQKNADVKQVLQKMRAEPASAEVQHDGCTELVILAADNDDNKTAIAAAGGIPVVLAAMKAHTGHVDVKGKGCFALRNLAVNADNQTAIAAAGGIPVVLAAMKAHKGHVDVQEHGCCALGNIGWSDPTLQKCIEDEGGVVVVQAAIAAAGATAQCKEHGEFLLGKLIKLAEAAGQAVRKDGCVVQ